MSWGQKLAHEFKSMGLVSLYFGVCIGALVLLKTQLLAEYQIAFSGFSKALVGVLILAKVVVVLEHVPLGAWVRSRPAWVDVVLRTALYAAGVLIVLLLEKTVEGRHEHGGIGASLNAAFRHAGARHVWINTFCVTGALLGYNALCVVRRHLGKGGLLRVFLHPLK